MSNHQKTWMVHGKPTTVKGVATRFRKSTKAVHQGLYYARRQGIREERVLESVYDGYLVRERIGTLDDRQWGGRQHFVFGQRMTVLEAAKMLGVDADTVRQWCYHHRDEHGRPASLEAAYYHYRQVERGERKQREGRAPVQHIVDGHLMTVREAAAAAGCSMQAIYIRMSHHKISLEEAYHAADRTQRKRAEREIMKILEGK